MGAAAICRMNKAMPAAFLQFCMQQARHSSVSSLFGAINALLA